MRNCPTGTNRKMTQHSSCHWVKIVGNMDNKHIYWDDLGHRSCSSTTPKFEVSQRGKTQTISLYIQKETYMSVRSIRNSKLNEHKLRSMVTKTERSFVSVYRVYSVNIEKYFGMDMWSVARLSPYPCYSWEIALNADLNVFLIFIFLMGWDWVHLVLRPLFGLLHKPQMIEVDDCGAVGGMRICRGNRSTRRKASPVPLCPPQISHDLTRARTLPAAMGSRLLTAWAMARPSASTFLS
jgi:hypothetical protein